MFYYLYEILDLRLFGYTTVRAGIAFFLSFALTIYLMPKFIAWARTRHANQPIYELAPKNHQKKSHIPTMGGIVFVSATLIASLMCANLSNLFVVLGICCIGGFSLIGFKDDIGKILGKSNHAGLSARKKFALQIALSIILALFLYFIPALGTKFYVPFYKYPLFEMGFFAVFFWTLLLTSASNAVNLTDGLDGLATIPAIFSTATLAIFAFLCGHASISGYLLLPKIVGVGEITIIATALIGALLGFLWFNCYPAQVFMGDSGSLAIGGFLGYVGIITKNEILLVIIGFVFVFETLSVILQVGSFKMRGKRIFLMAPFHHHLELKGWTENKIIVRFWIIAFLTNLIALASIKIR